MNDFSAPISPLWGIRQDPALLERLHHLVRCCCGLEPMVSGLPVISAGIPALPFTLSLQEERLTLRAEHEPQWAAIVVDLLAGSMAHRQRQPVGGERVVKAVWGRSKGPITVLDATAGLGRDGFLLASSGAQVVSCERHPAIALLLADGYWRAQQAVMGEAEQQTPSPLATVLSHWHLRHANAIEVMAQLKPEVVYLDPMFPEREKTALVKKEMRAFRDLIGEDVDAHSLFEAALAHATKRVVVKRPSSGQPIGLKPSHVLQGKSNRFDVYAVG